MFFCCCSAPSRHLALSESSQTPTAQLTQGSRLPFWKKRGRKTVERVEKQRRNFEHSEKKLAMSEEQAAATEPATAAATPAEEEETTTTTATAAAEAETEKPECGFCVFMKAGGCAEAFEAWSRCVDSAREAEKKEGEGEEAGEGGTKKEGGDGVGAPAAAAAAASSPSEEGAADSSTPDFAIRCREATMALQRCMEEHRDYYRDFLADAEEAVAEKMEGGGAGEEDKEAEKKE